MKKAELTMSTIVMAVIAVLVLIILAAILLNNIGDTEFDSCQQNGGTCSPIACSERNDRLTTTQSNWECRDLNGVDTGQYCCISAG